MPTEISGATGVNKVQSSAIETGDMPTGSVLQVVQVTRTNTQNSGFLLTTTSASWSAASLSAAITPSSTSSKILVQLNISVHHSNHASYTIYANGSNIGGSTYGLTRLTSSGTDWIGQFATILHSPSTTSSVTYQLYGRSESSGTFYIGGDSDVVNSITLMEIAG